MDKENNNGKQNTQELIHTIEKSDLEEIGMKRSRLNSSQSAKMKRNLILLFLGIIGLGIILLFAGPPLIIQYSILVGNMRSEEDAKNSEKATEESYLPPPILIQPEKATKEKTITIEGSGEGKVIELYVNDDLAEEKKLTGSDFTFSDIELKEGDNIIKAKTVSGKKESNFSQPVKVTYREKAPELEIETPKDGDAFSGSVSILKVKGKASPHAKVTINDAWAIMDDEGIFRYDFRMQSGENKIMVKATDEAGNRTEKEVKFSYSP